MKGILLWTIKYCFKNFQDIPWKQYLNIISPFLVLLKTNKQSFVFKNRRYLLMVLFAENVKRKIMISKKNVFLYIMFNHIYLSYISFFINLSREGICISEKLLARYKVNVSHANNCPMQDLRLLFFYCLQETKNYLLKW